MTNNLCFLVETFSQIKQDINSTFQFEINYEKNILFTPHTFINISQRVHNQNYQLLLLIHLLNKQLIIFIKKIDHYLIFGLNMEKI